jgi:thiamine monophosphate synthase
MFNSITGGFYSGYYEDGVVAAIKNSGKNLVARGGTNAETVVKTHDLGFHGIAFNSYIWESESPYQNFVKILSAFKENHITLE